MKITLEPTVEKTETHYDETAHYVSVSCDTRTNDDNDSSSATAGQDAPIASPDAIRLFAAAHG